MKFFDTNEEKLTKRAFIQSIAVSAFGIFLCVVFLCSATWAWFSVNVSSSTNTIRSASCDVSVLVLNENTAISAVDGKYTFEVGKEYQIKITATGTAATAYCILNVGSNSYYTDLIPTHPTVIDGNTVVDNSITFTIKFTTPTVVEVIPRWGASGAEETFRNGKIYIDLIETN